MAIDLTSKPLSSTYDQLLHVDDGPIAEEKTVYSGTGVPTALKLGTGSASVDNVRIDGSTISTVTPGSDLVLAPNGSGKVKITKAEITDQLTNVTIAGGQISNANIAGGQISNVNITGGQISNANIIGGTFHGVTPTPAGVALLDDADAAAQRATLGLGTAATKNVGTSGDAVPLLNGNNTFSGSNTFPTPTAAGNPLVRGDSVSLPNGIDLNTVVDTGFYRLGASVVNGPTGAPVGGGQLIVSRGGGSIIQIVASYTTGEMWTRSGNPPAAGGNGSWSQWLKVASPVATQAEMEAGTETAIRNMSPKLVAQAITALGSSGLIGLVGFTTITTTSAWTPNPNTKKLVVACFGGGGGGGSGIYDSENSFFFGGGGKAGCGPVFGIATTVSGTYSAIIGAGGAGGSNNSNGSTGGTTSFSGTGISVSALGGIGGVGAIDKATAGDSGIGQGGAPGASAAANSAAGGGGGGTEGGAGGSGIIYVWEFA